MHFSHLEHSVPTDATLDWKMWRKRRATCRQSFIHLLHLQNKPKWTETRWPYGLRAFFGWWSLVQIHGYNKKQPITTPSDLYQFSRVLNRASEHLKLHKLAPFSWSYPNASILPPFVHPFICFITSTILEQSWLLLEALSPERLLSLSSCSLIPKTLLLCFPTS